MYLCKIEVKAASHACCFGKMNARLATHTIGNDGSTRYGSPLEAFNDAPIALGADAKVIRSNA
jgi:hypothetical protein